MKPYWHEKISSSVRPEWFFWAALVLALFLIVTPERGVPAAETSAAAALAETRENPFEGVGLFAKAAYVYDVQKGSALFARNAEEPLPLASLTKVMTAVTALSLAPETTLILVTPEAIQAEGDSGLNAGERFLLRDLLKLMLLESANDAAVAISSATGALVATSTDEASENRALFILEMNRLARRLRLTGAVFGNETGLDTEAATVGAVASAAEAARLFGYALTAHPRIFTETRWSDLLLTAEGGAPHEAKNTNTNTDKFPLLIASKTGYTDLAGGNLLIAFDAGFNRPIIVVILGSTAEGRFTDAETLVWATLAGLSQSL